MRVGYQGINAQVWSNTATLLGPTMDTDKQMYLEKIGYDKEENEVAKDFFISTYQSPKCLEIIHNNDISNFIIEEVNKLEENYHRLTYIMYLLEMPKRPSRRKKFEKSNEKFMKRFKQVGADIDSIVDENTSCLMHFRDELNKLKENKK